MSKQIDAMRKAGFSQEEIDQMLADDKAVDRGEKMPWDLSDEEHKRAVKLANAGEKKEVKTAKTPRKVKENPTKRLIIAQIAQFLEDTDAIVMESCEISNPERVISFKIDGNSYELTLSQKRK